MTNKEIISNFPSHRLIKRYDIEPVLEEIFLTAETYHEVYPRIMKKCKELFPKPNGLLRFDGITDKDWEDYFWGRYNDKHEKVDDSFNDWVKSVEDEFIARRGQRHTFDEACHVAADQWCKMCFGNHIQDNGDKSETGYFGNLLATVVADEHKSSITKDVVEKANHLFYEYYKGGCIYEYEGRKLNIELDCDYHPNTPLESILVKAGVSKESANCICPIKTMITIDKKDNSVVVSGYHTKTYM